MLQKLTIRPRVLPILGFFLFFWSSAHTQELIISEFLASNQSGYLDEDGDRSDWIEIYNPNPEAISLEGWYLTDDADDLEKWRFPPVVIESMAFTMVIASGKNRAVVGEELHTNFRLNRDGEFLGLIKADGESVSDSFEPSYPAQMPDVSYGMPIKRERTMLVSRESVGRFHIPVNGDLGDTWTDLAFDDDTWSIVNQSLGYSMDVSKESGEPGESLPRPEVFGDVSRPGDRLIATSNRSPAGEEGLRAIDNDPDTKYLNFDKLNAGFTVTLAQRSVVNSLRLTSANDAPQRDPTRLILSGSNDGSSFQEIGRKEIPEFTARHQTLAVAMSNDQSYRYYRLIFPTIRDAASAVAMQIAEVEFIGPISEESISTESGKLNFDRFQTLTQPDDPIEPTSFNSPENEEVWRAIDNLAATKYLNFDGADSGFTVTPKVGDTVVKGLRLTSGNDAPGRDPASFWLGGSTNGSTFDFIAGGQLPLFSGRFAEVQIPIANELPYRSYRLLFPTLRGGAQQLMQIAEVEFVGLVGLPLPALSDLIATDVEDTMYAQHGSVYLRYPFRSHPENTLDNLILNTRFDAGFVAYLNGSEILRKHAPKLISLESLATTNRSREEMVTPASFRIENLPVEKSDGENVLAIHVLNDQRDSPEMIFDVEFERVVDQIDRDLKGYFDSPTPGKRNSELHAGIVMAPTVGVDSGFYEQGMDVSISSDTENAFIRYTLNGSEPTLTNGHSYLGPLSINATTVLKAASFRDGWKPSRSVTRSYLFLADIIRQNRSDAIAAGFPERWGSQVADYGLDLRVVGQNGQDSYGGRYSRTIAEDLQSLPSVSLVLDLEDLFGRRGIYSNPSQRGRLWERPVSMEWIDPDDGPSFQVNAGVRIQGGAFRRFDLTLKKSFRLVFRGQYGPAELTYPLFGPNAAQSFNNVVFRANGNDAWRWGGDRTLYFRDTFAMETARAMGMVAPHATFVHLYLNGQYWGLYNAVERPDAAFSASYHGGNRDTWDALNQDSAPDGDRTAWNRLLAVLNEGMENNEVYQRIQGKNADGVRDPALENLLDVENMIDYMILNFYLGNNDWPGRNHWIGRDREGTEGFQFYPWDTETTVGLNSDLGTNRTSVRDAVARPYGAALANDEFRMLFADRVHHHFFEGGALSVNEVAPEWSPTSPDNNRPAARFVALADRVERAIVAESARWGDQLSGSPFTLDEHWKEERDTLLRTYFPKRSKIVLEQLRQAGLYPNVDAPELSHPGGTYESGFELALGTPAGGIFYTLDGSDPRFPIHVTEEFETTLIDSSTETHVLVPTVLNGGNNLGPDWYRRLSFPVDDWVPGRGAVGYESSVGYQDIISIDVGDEMKAAHGSVYIRIPFSIEGVNLEQANSLILRMRYDDGFVAYLNGAEIASRNAPAEVSWTSLAVGPHGDDSAVVFQEIDISSFIPKLRRAGNLLAIQGFNVSLTSSDFLIEPELIIGRREFETGKRTSVEYIEPIALNESAILKARAFSGSEWSALVEATYVIGSPRLAVSEFHYNPAPPSVKEIEAGFTDSDDFEFIELVNAGSGSLSLKGLRFVDGISFDFPQSPVTHLAPTEVLVLVSNQAAFEQRYGADWPVVGQYKGRFSNGGERVAVVDSEDQTILEFVYDTQAPWPEDADGGGPSLTVANLHADPNVATSWLSSHMRGGTPGWNEDTESIRILTFGIEGGFFHIEFMAPHGIRYELYATDNLQPSNWEVVSNGDRTKVDGKERIQIPIPDEGHRFYQLQRSRSLRREADLKVQP